MFIVYLGNVFEICSVVYYTNVQRILQIVQHVCPARTPARRFKLDFFRKHQIGGPQILRDEKTKKMRD